MLHWIIRQPLMLLSAIGLVSLLKSVITFQEDILLLVSTYQSITQPVWEFLFGWLFSWLKMSFPGWLKDYLSIGVVTSAAMTRTKIVHKQFAWESRANRTLWQILAALIAVAFWPIVVGAFGAAAWSAKSKIERLENQREQLAKLQQADNATYSALTKELLGDPMSWKKYEIEAKTNTLTTAALFMEVFLWTALILAVNAALVNA